MTPRNDKAQQIAALPVCSDVNGKLRVLMVTSRDTGRWVMPKGWLMDGEKTWRAAEIEALEEAGATGFISHHAIGTYSYPKRLDDGSKLHCTVTIYPMFVQRLRLRWKERHERKRHWFSLKKAAKLVSEKELSEILLKVAEDPDQLTIIQELRQAS